MKISVLDEGRFNRPDNWTYTEGETFELFIDGNYIASVNLDPSIGLILVSTLHKVEFRKDD